MTQISQLSNLTISVAVCITAGVPNKTSPVPLQPNLLLGHFVTKASFYRFFLHQTQSKRDGNVHEKAWQTFFTLSPVLDLQVRPSAVLAASSSYTRTSTDSDSTLLSSGSPQTRTDSVRTRLVSLIHNSQFRCTERDQTTGNILVQLMPLQV